MSLPTPGSLPMAAIATPRILQVAPPMQTEDTWVTVFGFSQADLALVLMELQKCGDIVQWGAFGAPSTANFIHVQFMDKWVLEMLAGLVGLGDSWCW